MFIVALTCIEGVIETSLETKKNNTEVEDENLVDQVPVTTSHDFDVSSLKEFYDGAALYKRCLSCETEILLLSDNENTNESFVSTLIDPHEVHEFEDFESQLPQEVDYNVDM